MNASPSVYRVAADSNDFCLRQGELLSNVVQFRLDAQTLGGESLALDRIVHPFALILTQDCDLEQDFFARRAVVTEDK